MNAVVVLGVAAAIPGGLLAARQLLSTPRADVEATVSYGELPLPPGYAGGDYFHVSRAVDAAVSALPLAARRPDLPVAESGEVVQAVLAALARPGVGPLTIGGRPAPEIIHGYWHAVVRNGGTQQAQHVTLTLPDAAYACVSRGESVAVECGQVAPMWNLGTLLPNEEATVTVWTSRSIIPSLDLDRVRLAFADGVGAVILPERVTVPTIWHDIWTITLEMYGVCALLLFLVAPFFGWSTETVYSPPNRPRTER